MILALSPWCVLPKSSACRTFIAIAPVALLAQSGDEYSAGFIAFYSSFCGAAPKALPALRVARRNRVCAATPTDEPLAARRALQPLKPHNASDAQSPTGC